MEKDPGDFWVWMAGVLSDLLDYPFGQLDLENKDQNKSSTPMQLTVRKMKYEFLATGAPRRPVAGP